MSVRSTDCKSTLTQSQEYLFPVPTFKKNHSFMNKLLEIERFVKKTNLFLNNFTKGEY